MFLLLFFNINWSANYPFALCALMSQCHCVYMFLVVSRYAIRYLGLLIIAIDHVRRTFILTVLSVYGAHILSLLVYSLCSTVLLLLELSTQMYMKIL